MTLQDVFDQLIYGELSQLKVGETAPHKLSLTDQIKLTAHVNLGLTALYKRFALKEGRITIELSPSRLEYPLDSRFAQNNAASQEVERFILDSAEAPFSDDVLKVERALTDLGYECSLNDLADRYSLFTPTSTRLRVPADIAGQTGDLPEVLRTETLELVYRANHPKLDSAADDFDPEQLQLELPETHLEPLLLYVAMRMNLPLGAGQGEGFASHNYMTRYELACKQIEDQALQVDRDSQNTKLRDRGFA